MVSWDFSWDLLTVFVDPSTSLRGRPGETFRHHQRGLLGFCLVTMIDHPSVRSSMCFFILLRSLRQEAVVPRPHRPRVVPLTTAKSVVSAFCSFASHNRASPRYPDKKVSFTPQLGSESLEEKKGCQIRGLNVQKTLDIETSSLVRIRMPREEGRFVTRRELGLRIGGGLLFSAPHLGSSGILPQLFPLGTGPSLSIINDTAALRGCQINCRRSRDASATSPSFDDHLLLFCVSHRSAKDGGFGR